tara:strand:+ start:13490 stop:13852 length:363 start_codon:yes stop_codon:yes gene_type:complete
MSEYNKPGQPTLYKEEYNEQVVKLCLLGSTDKDLADFFNVAESTINNWKISHPEFLESIKEGKQKADCDVAQSLYNKAINGDTVAALFWLKNRKPDKWRDKQEIKQEVDLRTITIINADK